MTLEPPLTADGSGTAAVLRNRPFLLLWLSQLATQVGSNMVLYGLTVIVLESTNLSSAVSALFLTFLVPAVLLSAVAGVYIDRVDRRLVLVLTNVLRAVAMVAIWWVGGNVAAILLLNVVVSVITVFFAPAEAAMIPQLVPRHQLVSANGLFTLTLNGAFALGYALLGPLVVKISGGPESVLLVVAALYVIAAVFCFTLPSSPPGHLAKHAAGLGVHEAGEAARGTFSQLAEGITYIRAHRAIGWSLVYLGIAASIVGVIGVLGPDFAEDTLGLKAEDLFVVVLPLGIGIVMGVLLLNSYGRFIPRRRAIEGGLIVLGTLLAAMTIAGPISRALQQVEAPLVDLSAVTSLIAVVIAMAFVAGIAYGIVAISSQTQLQEDLPQEVRGRVFGVLNMLVSVGSFLPIIIVGPISDLVGTTAVILFVAGGILLSGIVSIVRRGPLAPAEERATAGMMVPGTAVDPIGVAMRTEDDIGHGFRTVSDRPAWTSDWAATGENVVEVVVPELPPEDAAATVEAFPADDAPPAPDASDPEDVGA
ncbi:MAG TPA: MFS transporter [Candidatus Limnocylindrales bacterium]|nr:MFS transporter [Candidatus Limnocylindrales bacterium]